MWARIAVMDSVRVQIYDPFRQERKAYLGSADVEVGFAGKTRIEEPYDQNELAHAVIEVGYELLSYVKVHVANWQVEIQKPDFGARPKSVDGPSRNTPFANHQDR